MYAKHDFLWKLALFILPGIVLLTGCGVVSGEADIPPSATVAASEPLRVPRPETARDVALAYIRTYHAGTGPSEGAFWFDETANAEGLVGSSTLIYRYEAWMVRVTFPVVLPEETIYTISVERHSPKFNWQGLVDAYGQVVETSFSVADPQPTAPAATATPLPTPTASPLPTATVTSIPTNTPIPSPSPTAIQDPCNAAEFLGDVTIQDGSTFLPGASFTKTWRLKNTGTCTWTSEYDLVFADGWLMSGNQTQGLSGQVKPGESVDISINLKAPNEPGDYQGLWMLRDAGGVLFGLGDNANKAFWVSIIVVDFEEGDYEYDFGLNYCEAIWQSENGRVSCPGFTNSEDGFVQLLASADLEHRRENEPTLWVHPNEERYGWLEGTYPRYKVGTGDHFLAWVGCLNGYDRCDLTFYLDVLRENGKVYRLAEWTETFDREVTKIDIDLVDLEGERVRFILGVKANTKNVTDAQGFWFVPRIE